MLLNADTKFLTSLVVVVILLVVMIKFVQHRMA